MTTLAQVFEGAVAYLYESHEESREVRGKFIHSCNAVSVACRNLASNPEEAERLVVNVSNFVWKLGLPFKLGMFSDLYSSGLVTENAQQARVLWLTWLAMLAEEEGV